MLNARTFWSWMLAVLLVLATPDGALAAPQDSYSDHLDAADAAYDEGDYGEAADQYGAALQKKRTFEALLGRGQSLYFQDGHDEEALDPLTQAVELRPKNVECRNFRASVYAYLERPKEAMDDYDAVLKIDRVNEEATLGYAQAASDLDLDSKGTRILTRFLKANPDHVEARLLRAELYSYRNLLNRSIADYVLVEDALREEGECVLYAQTLTFAGQLEEGREWIGYALEDSPEYGYAHWVSGLNYYLQKDYAAAAAEEELAKELDPSLSSWDYRDYAGYGADGELGELGEVSVEEIVKVYAIMFAVWALVVGVLGLLIGQGGARFLQPKDRRNDRGVQPVYDGEHKELFTIYLQNVVFTLLTLGVYRFWAKVRTRKFHYQHTNFADGRFDYHATGKEKFVGFLKGMAILAPLGVAWYFASDAAGPGEGGQLLVNYAFFGALFMVRPLALVGGQRFNLARTSWNNLRFRFTGLVKDAYKLYGRDLVFIVLTLGLYYPWHVCNVRRFKFKHSAIGDQFMDFKGSGNELFGIQFGGTFLSVITLGLYVPWYIAARKRFFIGRTKWVGKPLSSSLTGKAVLAVAGPGMLLSILTFGLALPWAMTRWKRLLCATTVYRGEIEPETMRSIQDTAATSTVEGIGEAGDVLSEIGDLFGL